MAKKLYTTTMTNTGGRAGEVWSNDKKWDFKIGTPGVDKDTTNPEQLFAAGYASCFNGALEIALQQAGVTAESTVRAKVALYQEGDGPDFHIGVDLFAHVDGVSEADLLTYLDQANQICPYSKATRGNIEVTLNVE
jgi:Ohr subfamily peroxiredoxin